MVTAELIFQQSGLKSTASRLKVTAALVKSNTPLTHQDLLTQLPMSFDRVTLYRVLDWLLQNKVIHRIAGEDRIWRFQLNASNLSDFNSAKYSKSRVLPNKQMFNKHSHAHFQCADCGKVFCLEDVQPKFNKKIPIGFTVDSIELNIKGKCANCVK